MIDKYAQDEDCASIINDLHEGKEHEPFLLKEGFLMHSNKLCITIDLYEKVMLELHVPSYVGHKGIQMTMQAMSTYFYWPFMKQDVHRL